VTAADFGNPPDVRTGGLHKPKGKRQRPREPQVIALAGSPDWATSLTNEAAALGLNPDAISAAALKKAIGDEKARRWAEENREAIAAHHRYVEEHGLPLAKYRMF